MLPNFSFPAVLLALTASISCSDLSGFVIQDKVPNVPRETLAASEIFLAPVLNSQTWRSGEFLVLDELVIDNVRESDSGLPGDGHLVEQRSWMRFAFDHDAERFAVYGKTNVDVVDFRQVDGVVPNRFSLEDYHSGCVDMKSGDMTLWDPFNDVRKGSTKANGLVTVDDLVELRYRDFRSCWSTGPYTSENFRSARKTAQSYRRVVREGKVNVESDGIKDLVFKMVWDPGKSKQDGSKWVRHRRIRFDKASSMPVFHGIWYISKPGNVKRKTFSISIDWTERSGIYVPKRIVEYDLFRDPSKISDSKLPGQRTLSFIWLSINEVDADGKVEIPMLELDLVDAGKKAALDLLNPDLFKPLMKVKDEEPGE